MARDRDISQVKEVISEGLKGVKSEIYIERIPTTKYLHVWVISDAFENYPEMERMSTLGELFEKAWAEDAVCPQITRLFPLTPSEFTEPDSPRPLVVEGQR